ncbi:carbon starvation protein A [Sporomusa sp.]|jgi:carbon starvation protein|uniref:carbon starvation CstA family protein n=1 Tax=Sporomusa sp. TaxID=2078658 RepID=UPI002B8FD3CC|nr:carbon starvation protein A [Sporomusa sp.]HWR08960.1 carbon starvation protein A [Sporomusa sp.]
MNSVSLLIISVCVYILAYRYYSAFIAAKVLALNDSNITPAYRCKDGREFVPTNKWVLFGHHFAAIAGAGPLVGPVLAAQYGWGPGFMWILLGSVFAGAVHDFIILFASIRHNGQSLAVIARREVGPLTGITTSLAVFFIIIVALAGLAIVVVNALFKNPWGLYTLFMTIPIAIIVGLYMFKIAPGSIRSGSIAGFIMVMAAVVTGHWLSPGQPWAGLAGIFDLTKQQLSVALPVYGFFAAVLPVWLLLAPRDYLSSYMKIGTILALALGILIVQPNINMPMTTRFMDGGGPIIPGPWWPYVFITIACGAISGFHSLISSGTTPKMIELESQSRMIAFGGMLTEGFVAVMALISAVVLMPGDYFAINSPAAVFAKLGIPTVEINELSRLVQMDVAHRPGGAVSLAVGMAHIFSSIGGMQHLMSYWYQFAIMFEALFILTTIDAGTRVARYILQDILGTYLYSPLKQTNWWPGILFTSFLVTYCWGYLLYSGDVASIWPLFGVANQLLSVIALAIGTTIILKIAPKKSYAWVTFAPLSFLAVTVITAGIMNVQMFYKRGDALGNTNGTVSIILIVLVIITLLDSIRQWISLLKTDKPVGMNTEVSFLSCPVNTTKPNIPS